MDEPLESATDSHGGKTEKTPDHKRQNGSMNRRDDPASGEQPLSQSITILHFNDVYNINEREEEPVGGAARFATAMRQLKHLDPLVLFSGDIFNPSVMSAVTKGEQMVPILKALGVKCAVFGNHDFDFGMDHVVDLVKRTELPWLMSNVYDNVTEDTLADGLITHMISWKGRKIGLVGLVEEAWIETLATVDPEEITFVDFVEEGCLLAKQLKQDGADIVIALTHMRWPNDVRLAECAPEIDLILGGHDHDYLVKQVNGKFIIKSGSDFRNFSEVTLSFLDDGHINVNVREVVVDSSFSEDAEVKTIVDKFTDVMSAKMEMVLGVIDVDLEGRFAKVRTQETNLGNFITDIMLKSVDADLALLNSGTLRSDMVHRAGPFKMKDLMSILPMVDPLVVIQLTGRHVLSALENSVSQYPNLEGRFAQVAGVRFSFDPQKPVGHRIEADDVEVQGITLDLDENYRLCTKQYLAEGKDGYTAFKGCPVLLNDEDGPRLSTCIVNYFKSVQMLRDKQKSQHCHRHSILTVTRRKTLTRQMSVDFWMGAEACSETSSTQSWYHANVSTLRRKSMVRQLSVELPPDNTSSVSRSKALLQRRSSIEICEKESVATAMAPQVDGRVSVISGQGSEGWTL